MPKLLFLIISVWFVKSYVWNRNQKVYPWIHSYEENLNTCIRKKFNTLTNNSSFLRILETGSRWGTDSGLRCWPRNRYLCHTQGTSCRCTQRPGAVDISGVSAAGCRPAAGTCCPLYNRQHCPVYSDLPLPHSYPQCTHFRSGNLDLQSKT